MWEIKKPNPVKLITGILAADENYLNSAVDALAEQFGNIDLQSDVWPFKSTEYYKDQTGDNILKQYITFEKLIDPGQLAAIKHKTNQLEQQLAENSDTNLPRPVNLDPGFIEPSKLVLGSTKNFSHRVYIGDSMYAEVTLTYCRGKWQSYPYTFPDHTENRYHGFLTKVRDRLTKQLKEI